jgi:hypothetical protein
MMLRVRCPLDFPDMRTILTARDALFAAREYGPFVIFVPCSRWADINLDNDYIPVGISSAFHSMHTVRNRILQIDGIERIEYSMNTADYCVLLAGTMRTCQIACTPKKVAS